MSIIHQMGAVPGVGSTEGGSSPAAARQAVMKAMMSGARMGRAPETDDTSSSQGGRQEVDRATLDELAHEANSALSSATALRFRVDDEADRLVVKVIDRDTEELIRQIPSEDFLELVRRMRDMQGVLFDTKA